ncbi:MAG: hypothetical protein ACREE6_06000 [Limisphaerales bacterium]
MNGGHGSTKKGSDSVKSTAEIDQNRTRIQVPGDVIAHACTHDIEFPQAKRIMSAAALNIPRTMR